MVKANLSFPFLSSNYLLTRCFDSKRWYVRNLTASWQFLHMAADETHSLLSRLFEQHLISPWCPKLRKKRSKETLLLRKVLPPTFSIFGCISNKFPLWERRRRGFLLFSHHQTALHSSFFDVSLEFYLFVDVVGFLLFGKSRLSDFPILEWWSTFP